MQSQKIMNLLDRYIRGELTEEERLELTRVLADPEQAAFVEGELARMMEVEGGKAGSEEGSVGEGAMAAGAVGGEWEPVLQRVLSVDRGSSRVGDGGGVAWGGDAAEGDEGSNVAGGGDAAGRGVLRSLRYDWRRWSAAAVLVLLLGGGGALFLTRHRAKGVMTAPATAAVAAILPGNNRAILTLANGQQIPLNSVQKGILTQQGNTKVIKLDSGRLAYTVRGDGGGRDGGARDETGGADGKVVLYNTITTPRGGQYQVTLPDGTSVWLNAESALRFPTAFTGKEREVVLTGEAYLEVAADKDHPFVVRAGSAVTRVLGTQFNIMAYGDEGAVKTTLLAGAVSMEQASKSVLLHPGEQGQYDDGKGVITTRAVNTRAVVAWKDGYYYFDRTPVRSVMRQIARWYDVEIVYAGAVPKDEIVGRIPRTAYVSEVLHIMELIGIHFKIEGRKIIVLN